MRPASAVSAAPVAAVTVRRSYEVTDPTSPQPWTSKPIQLPGGTRKLNVKPNDLNDVLTGAERAGYPREDIRTIVDWLNALHGAPDPPRRFPTWQALFEAAAEESGANTRRRQREQVVLDKRLARWPEQAAHRAGLDDLLSKLELSSGAKTPDQILGEVAVKELRPHLLDTLRVILRKNFRPAASGALRPAATEGARLDRFELLAQHLLTSYPATDWIYVIAGNSLVATGIYLTQLNPECAVVNLPASNVGVGKMTNEKFDHRQFVAFYHLHFGRYLEQIRAGRRLLVIDYSKAGATLRVLREGISHYLGEVGLHGADSVETFGFGASNLGPEGKADEMKALHADLEREVMKDAGAVLFEKTARTAFTGDVMNPQAVCVDAYISLWNAIVERIKSKAPVVQLLQ